MKENKYDDNIFFQKYSQMSRSQQGLAGAGEWETLRKLLPDFKDKRVLDLGCGYGWHCIYAMEHGASSVCSRDTTLVPMMSNGVFFSFFSARQLFTCLCQTSYGKILPFICYWVILQC